LILYSEHVSELVNKHRNKEAKNQRENQLTEPANQSINQSIDRSIDQSINQSTISMQQILSRAADTSSNSKEFCYISCNPKVCFLVHKSGTFLPVLRHISEVHLSLPYFFNIHFNLILTTKLYSCNCYQAFSFSYQKLIRTALFSICATSSCQLTVLLDSIILVISGKEHKF